MNEIIVEAREVHKTYHQMEKPVLALRGISLAVHQGDLIAIVGPSGCGKSTFLHLLGALDSPSSGEVRWHGESIVGWTEQHKTRLRLQKIGFVFQRFYLLPMLTAQENVELPMREERIPPRLRAEKAAYLLDSVNLAERRNHRPSQLSGGEMQRVAIARALANDPELLLADEPTGELDAATGLEIVSLFQRFHENGLTIVMVTHNPDLAASAKLIQHMRDGKWE
ncbi:ABC transporter ATP-binding protein [bacterium]|nr:ABC transporter ATP-binding protein [bacterium]MCI0602164.1 ABC transporter ATP-binding protein [bacterium]